VPILGLVWTLILRYQINKRSGDSAGLSEDDDDDDHDDHDDHDDDDVECGSWMPRMQAARMLF
jgi:hypothetical protein